MIETVQTPRRTPTERALLDYLRADAWRFDEPERAESWLIGLLANAPGVYSVYELNVLYELICLYPTVDKIIRVDAASGRPIDDLPIWLGRKLEDTSAPENPDLTVFPIQLMATTLSVDGGDVGVVPDDVRQILNVWRNATRAMRKSWGGWSKPEALPRLIADSFATIDMRHADTKVYAAMRPVLTLACESLLRIAWIYECEAIDALAYGPVSDRRLPRDPAEAVITLRRFAEQQPELRKVPAFVHTTNVGTPWLRPREYARLRTVATDEMQSLAIARDGFDNRRYVHDHLAVIEVDRKPWKMIVLAPEHHDPITGTMFLDALMVHEKGAFMAEALVRDHGGSDVTMGLVLPFGGHAWRGLPEAAAFAEQQSGASSGSILPPDGAVLSLIVAAWRDLVVAKVREQQYEATVTRDDATKGKRTARAAARGHLRVVRYLPRMVVIRRAEEAERLEGGATRAMSRAFRVGTFARTLRDGHRRSREAQEFADEIGMPLRDDQTIVRPHIRGGTEEEREALLAQDDVRLWKSWAAIDLLFATGSSE